MARPRILYFLHAYFTGGGCELHTRDLALGLVEDFDTYVAYPKPGEVILVREDRPIGRYASDTAWSPLSPLTARRCEDAIGAVMAKVNPDIVHIQHTMYWPVSMIDRLIARRRPVLMTFHDYFAVTPLPTLQFGDVEETLTREYSERVFKRDHSRYLGDRRRMLTHSLHRLSLRIVPSAFAAGEIRKAFPLDFRVVEHGIHPFDASRRSPAVGAIRFGFVGNLIPQKGWRLVLQAFPEVRARHPLAELHFFGWSPKPLSTRAPGVFFHGAYRREALGAIMGSIDVGIIPSVAKETFGYVLSEMWQASLPVAVADIGALGQRVSDGINGRKFAPASAEAIRDAMLWFLEDDRWKSWSLPRPRLMSDMLAEYRAIYRNLVAETARPDARP